MQEAAFDSLLMPDRTTVDYLLVADYAEVINGKSYIVGGGWDRLSPPSYPAELRIGIAAGVRVPFLESNRPHHFSITLRDGDGGELFRVEGDLETGRPPRSRGESTLVPIAMNAPLRIEKPQTFELTAQVGESVRHINIRAMSSGPAGP